MKRKFVAGLAGLTLVMAPALASAQERPGAGRGVKVDVGLLIALDVVLASVAAYKILESLRDNGRPRSA
jgi:hypothetical protein